MKFSCSSEELSGAVGTVEKAISSRTALPVMENIYMALEGSTLTLRGNDLEVGIEYRLPVSGSDQTGKALVKGSTISSIVGKMPKQTLSLEVDESNKLTLHGDNVDFDLLGQSVSEYPEFPVIKDGTKVTLTAGQLADLIKHTIFSVSFDETKQFLNGILLKLEGDSLHFVATDGFRLALKQLKLESAQSNISVIVPFKAMNELNKIVQQLDSKTAVSITISDNQIAFSMPNILLVSRLIQGQFPDYQQVLPKVTEVSYRVARRHLVGASERAQIIASQSNNVVRLTFGDTFIRVKAVAPKMGEFKEDVEATRLSGNTETKVSFNVKLILDAIKQLNSDDLTLAFNNELSPCVLRPISDDTFTYIIMPIRTSDYDEETQQPSSESVTETKSEVEPTAPVVPVQNETPTVTPTPAAPVQNEVSAPVPVSVTPTPNEVSGTVVQSVPVAPTQPVSQPTVPVGEFSVSSTPVTVQATPTSVTTNNPVGSTTEV
ncbi:DNA polymerase III subunit beta [bacterium]|jgi:DNA polymerase III subunit beta|nr:DNA polymerase III subunit beta [bacterium]